MFIKLLKKSPMTTDYVKRHGLKPTMRAFSVNDTMINGAPEQLSAIYFVIMPMRITIVFSGDRAKSVSDDHTAKTGTP